MTDPEKPAKSGDHILARAKESGGILLRVIAASRIIFLLAVFGTFIVSVLLVVQGTVMAVLLVLHSLDLGKPGERGAIRTEALEMVDIYLVALVLFVISMGFYQLLIVPNLPLPHWLRIESPAELETKLIGVLVTVIGVEAVVQLNSWDGSTNLIAYGVTSALVIGALAYYAWVHRHHQHGEDDPE